MSSFYVFSDVFIHLFLLSLKKFAFLTLAKREPVNLQESDTIHDHSRQTLFCAKK